MRRAFLLGLLGLAALGAAAYAWTGGASSPTPDAPVLPPEAAAPPTTKPSAPEAPPRLAGIATQVEERRKRAYERFLVELAEIERLYREGKYREALAALEALRAKHPDLARLAKCTELAGKVEAAVRGLERAQTLRESLLREKLTEEQRLALDRQLAASAEVLARAGNDADLDQLTRHLRRFLLDGLSVSASKDPTDQVLQSFLADRRARRGKDTNPPVADQDEAEKRRVDQLEKLRQRDAVGLLDAIHAGLAWLALHQRDDGASCDQATLDRCAALGHKPSCLGDARGTGDGYALAATGLAAIAFLDFRDQDAHGWFDPYLGKALAWLVKQQQPDGSWKGSNPMYSGAIATMAMGQAAVSTGKPEYREAARKAVQWYNDVGIGPLGGFRYGPADRLGDLSVTAWVAQACEAGRAAGVPIPPRISVGLPVFLQYVWMGDAKFKYTREQTGPSPSLAPAGMLVAHIAWDPADRDPLVLQGWKRYLEGLDPKRPPDLYTLYYGVRVSILMTGGLEGPWRQWAFDLAKKQVRGTNASGSFPADLWRWPSGPTVTNAVSVLTLEHALYLR